MDSGANWTKERIAAQLYRDSDTVITDQTQRNVSFVSNYLSDLGFELGGVESDGDCFFWAFLESYSYLGRQIPLLNEIEHIDGQASNMRNIVGENVERGRDHGDRGGRIKQRGEWITAQEGSCLARHLDIPIRVTTIQGEKGETGRHGIHDELFVSGEGGVISTGIDAFDVDTCIFLVDLGGHFVFAKQKGRTKNRNKLEDRKLLENQKWAKEKQIEEGFLDDHNPGYDSPTEHPRVATTKNFTEEGPGIIYFLTFDHFDQRCKVGHTEDPPTRIDRHKKNHGPVSFARVVQVKKRMAAESALKAFLTACGRNIHPTPESESETEWYRLSYHEIHAIADMFEPSVTTLKRYNKDFEPQYLSSLNRTSASSHSFFGAKEPSAKLKTKESFIKPESEKAVDKSETKTETEPQTQTQTQTETETLHQESAQIHNLTSTPQQAEYNEAETGTYKSGPLTKMRNQLRPFVTKFCPNEEAINEIKIEINKDCPGEDFTRILTMSDLMSAKSLKKPLVHKALNFFDKKEKKKEKENEEKRQVEENTLSDLIAKLTLRVEELEKKQK